MKKYSGFCVPAMCLLVLSQGAMAQDEFGGDEGPVVDRAVDRRMYVAPMLSYTVADKDRLTEDGYGGVISVGKRMTNGLNLELTGLYTEMKPEGSSDTNAELYGVGIGAMLFLWRSIPELYFLTALHQGQANSHPTTPASTEFSYKTVIFDTGVGYLLPLTDATGGFEMLLRTEARYRMDHHTRASAGVGDKKSFYEGLVNIGLLIPLGRLPVTEAAPGLDVVAPASADSDADGISDDIDQCPDTPFGTAVGASGCEEEADADADGVADRLDSCPDTAVGTPVDEQGCTLVADADADGIPDTSDQCPDTPAGTTVNETGCEQPTGCREPAPGEPITLDGCATGESIVLRGVTFEFNQARLTANAKVILNGVADSLVASPTVKVEIGGHSDSLGRDSYNLKLSEQRAKSVYDYLVSRGVPADRISWKGYGEASPIDSNETEEGRENNRRVEMKIQ